MNASFRFRLVAISLLLTAGCSRNSPTAGGANSGEPSQAGDVVLHKMPSGQEFSGFLKDYSQLKPNPELDGNAVTYARKDAQKNLHRYIAVIVDPVQVYLATDADESKLPAKARGAAARYFHRALIQAVSSAFPVVDQAGPLVLRLRAAIIGVDAGGAVPDADKSADADGALANKMNIGRVGVEMELVDSETGEQIAAMVDREKLGDGAEIGSSNFSRDEKWAGAREAFDGWAVRVRQFLDAAEELSPEDANHADQSYRPYGADGTNP